MRKVVYRYLVLFLVAGSIIALDQWTKSLIRANLAIGETWLPDRLAWLLPYARFVHWFNTGVAFGMFQGMGGIFTVLAILVALAIIYYYPRVPDSDGLLRLAMSMQLAGAVGNLIDRLTNNGQVTDFISLGNFAVFNVADMSISIGVAVLLLGIWLQENHQKHLVREQAAHAAGESSEAEETPPFDQLHS